MRRRGLVACLTVTILACRGADGPSDRAPAANDRPERPSLEQADRPGLRLADSIVSNWVSDGRISGAVLYVDTGDEAYEGAYGFAEEIGYHEGEYRSSLSEPLAANALMPLAEPRAMTGETVFDLASVTKVMATTFAIMILVDRGHLDLDAPVSDYLPDFAVKDPAKAGITTRHLLTHRSGLAQWQPTYYHAESAEQAYRWIRDQPLVWEVGSERHYSDLGFMVLGQLIEVISGDPLDSFLNEQLFEPLGLTSTGFNPPDRPALAGGSFAATSHGNPFEYRMVHDSAFGYLYAGSADSWNGWRRRTLVGEVNDGNAFHAFRGIAGHAGLFSTAADLAVLLRILSGLEVRSDVVSPSTIQAFLTEDGEGQALGWQIPDYAPPGSFFHTGFTGTLVMGIPSSAMNIVLLTNRQHKGVDEDARYIDVDPLRRAVVRALLDNEAGTDAVGRQPAGGP